MPKLLPVRFIVCVRVCVSQGSAVGCVSRVCVSDVCVCVCLVCVCGLAVIIYNLKRGRSLAPPLFACHSVCVCATFPLPLATAPAAVYILLCTLFNIINIGNC